MPAAKTRKTVNATRLRKIADAIEKNPCRYNQRTYCDVTECGTAHCIAGWNLRLKHPRMNDSKYAILDISVNTPNIAQRDLRLTSTQANYLFSTQWKPWNSDDTVPQALRKLCTPEGRRECKKATGINW